VQLRDKLLIATGFVIDKARLVTAEHCLPEGALVSIEGWDLEAFLLISMYTPGEFYTSCPFKLRRGHIDLAVLQFERDPFPDVPKFKLWGARPLDEVLCMGFPPMKGFEATLVAGNGQILSEEYSTIGGND
jgi:hypothetical protein